MIVTVSAVYKPNRSIRCLATNLCHRIFCLRLFQYVMFCVLIAPVPNQARAADKDSGYWTTVSAGMAFAKNWTAALAVQTRSANDFGDLERTVLRPSISYTRDKFFRATLGYDAHFIELPRDRVEQRLWQQWSARWFAAPVSLSTRLRLEERFIEDVDGTSVRLRLLGKLVMPITDSPVSAIVRNEYFVGLNDLDNGPQSGFDQNRAFAGMRYKISEHQAVEFGYQMQHLDRGSLEDITVHQLLFSVSLN